MSVVANVTRARVLRQHGNVPWLRMSCAGSLLLLLSCGAGARMVLESPVNQQCASTGLKGCPEITEGVLLYIDGKHGEATAKLHEAVAENEPEKLRAFADAVKELRNIPGADSYTGQLVAIAALLSPDDPTASAASSTASGAPKLPSPEQLYAGTDVDPEGKQPAPPAWSKVASLRAGTVFAESDKRAKSCTVTFNGRAESGTCVRAAIGPLVVTDLERVGGCPRDLAVWTGSADTPSWVLAAPLSVHSAAMKVEEAEPLTVFLAEGSEAPDGGGIECGVTWAGRRP